MRHAETVVWPGGEHPFKLGIGELRAVEQRCDAGCFVVLMRLLGGQSKIDDVLAPLRLGLIGGGMEERNAQKALDAALEVASPYKLTVVAADILRRFLMWEAEEETSPGEAAAGQEVTTPPRSGMDELDGPATTEPELF